MRDVTPEELKSAQQAIDRIRLDWWSLKHFDEIELCGSYTLADLEVFVALLKSLKSNRQSSD